MADEWIQLSESECMNKDDWHMMLVYLVAMRSKDDSTHIGAVVVGPDNEIRSVGFNGFVRGIDDFVKERQISPEKYYWMEHAERNAIFNSSLVGLSLKDCIMYTNGIPCADCARAIIQAGIKEVVYDIDWNFTNQDIWKEHAKRAIVMFAEAKVELRGHSFVPFDIKQRRRGKEFFVEGGGSLMTDSTDYCPIPRDMVIQATDVYYLYKTYCKECEYSMHCNRAEIVGDK